MAFKSLEKKTRRIADFDMPEEPHFPMLHVDSKQVPEILEWKVGEEYEIKIKIRQTSFTEREGSLPEAGFEIISYKT